MQPDDRRLRTVGNSVRDPFPVGRERDPRKLAEAAPIQQLFLLGLQIDKDELSPMIMEHDVIRSRRGDHFDRPADIQLR